MVVWTSPCWYEPTANWGLSSNWRWKPRWNHGRWYYSPAMRTLWWVSVVNTLRPRQNGRHFPDDIFKWIFLNENVWISMNISLKCVPRGPINNIPTLVQVMAWCRSGDKPLSEPMIVRLPTHICVTRPQWVKKQSNIHVRINELIVTINNIQFRVSVRQ